MFGEKVFEEKVFGKKVFREKVFGEKVFREKVFGGKGVQGKGVRGKRVWGKGVWGKGEEDIRIRASMCSFYTLQYFIQQCWPLMYFKGVSFIIIWEGKPMENIISSQIECCSFGE